MLVVAKGVTCRRSQIWHFLPKLHNAIRDCQPTHNFFRCIHHPQPLSHSVMYGIPPSPTPPHTFLEPFGKGPPIDSRIFWNFSALLLCGGYI